MGKLFIYLAAAIPTLLAQLLAFFGRKFTVATAAVAAMVLSTSIFIVAINAIVAGIVSTLSIPSWIATFMAWFVPSNTTACLSALLTAKVAKQAYILVSQKIDIFTKAS